MPATKTIIKKTHQEAVVKVVGTGGGSVTIDLSDDLLPTGQVLDGATQKASIVAVMWTGDTAGAIEITRGLLTVMNLQAAPAGQLFFDGQIMPPDNTGETDDISVTITGDAELWIRLRKTAGYKTTIEPEQFGPYDDPTKAGE